MAFTYTGVLDTDLDRVRFWLQDVTLDSGPKPGDANFTDAELEGLVTVEGSWQRAVAAGYETLAAAWTRYPTFDSKDGLRLDRTAIAEGYRGEAAKWRKLYGTSLAGVAGVAGGRAVIRVDGYSDDVDSFAQ